jgi:uncharacterized protein YrrD
MLHDVKELEGHAVGATDGEIGFVSDVYFDDLHWTIRYLVIETGGWLRGRKVLITPSAIRRVDWDDEVIAVSLTRQQVRDSPSIDTDKPVSRQHEMHFYDYYGYPYYWQGAYSWGTPLYPMFPADMAESASADDAPRQDGAASAGAPPVGGEGDTASSHLRSTNDVVGHEAMAGDGRPVGSVRTFLFDEESWAIRHLVVNTGNWLPGKHVLVSPAQIQSIGWREREVHLDVTREEVEASPPYTYQLMATYQTHE